MLPHPPAGEVVSAFFDQDGRLWRVIAGKERVYVDHSDDLGHSFSPPVVVNPDPQTIRATPEDRPAIAIDEEGRILVVYAAATKSLPWMVYYSYSTDGGRHFTQPVSVVPERKGKTYQAGLGVVGHTFHLFWHQGKAAPHGGTPLYWASVTGPEVSLQPRITAENQCECCRIALAFDSHERPVVLSRFVFAGAIRDHGLVFPAVGSQTLTRRISYDDWQLNACPEHGPALAIDSGGQLHMVWFTLGSKRHGLYYARSQDRGATVSEPMAVGKPEALAGHPAILASGKRVVLVWQEFDGRQTMVKSKQSHDRGAHWSKDRLIAATTASADYPFLITDGQHIYLSWNAVDGYRLIPIP